MDLVLLRRRECRRGRRPVGDGRQRQHLSPEQEKVPLPAGGGRVRRVQPELRAHPGERDGGVVRLGQLWLQGYFTSHDENHGISTLYQTEKMRLTEQY